MDELGFNKIAGAVLATALGIMVLRAAPHSLIHTEMPETPAYSVGPMEAPTDGPVEDLPFPQAEWVAAMDAERGAKVFKKCTSCHNADNGGAHLTGPNLWNVVGSASASRDDFKYSGAMVSSDIVWDYESLNEYLTKPTKYVSGTNMNFVGLKKESDRAAVIELLRLAADAPIDQPAAAIVEVSVPDTAPVIEEPVTDPSEVPTDQ